MLTEERQELILQRVNQNGSATTGELMQALDASESTIRRDISALDKENRLTKVHGGAVALKQDLYRTKDDRVEVRKSRNVSEKDAIAKKAASLITDRDFVYLDAGTTTERMIDYLDAPYAAFVTNAIEHARKLSNLGYTVYLLGGEFKVETEAIVGEEAVDCIGKYNFTKGFFGVNGITLKNGFTTPELKEAMLKKKAMDSSKDAYVLADESKFGQISAISFGELESATAIITNKLTNPDFKGLANVVEVNK